MAEIESESESDQLQSASHDHEEAKFKKEDEEGEEGCTLQFLDSLDAYLTLVDSLSSSLRQVFKSHLPLCYVYSFCVRFEFFSVNYFWYPINLSRPGSY